MANRSIGRLAASRLRGLSASLALVVTLGIGSTPARADSASSFKEAIELFEAKKCGEALPLFESVVAETGSPNARIYVARCLKQEGRLAEAYEQMRQTVTEATQRAETEDKYVPTRDSAAAELAMLEPKIGKVVVAVVDPPQGTKVYVGSRELEGDQLGVPVAVMPGTLDVRAAAPDNEPITREIEVQAGKTRTVTLTFEESLAGDSVPAPPKSDDESSGGGMGPLRIAGFVVTGVGLVGVGVGAGLAAKAQSDFDSLDEECGGTTCPAAEQDRIDSGRTLTTIANVSLIAGGIIAAGGVTMIIFGGDSEPGDSADAQLQLLPIVGPTMNGLTLTGRF